MIPVYSTLCLALLTLGTITPLSAQTLQWYRGNTHTHTRNSDGDATADAVVRWYREHGYHFVVITDHEFLTDVKPLQALFGADGKFLVMPGQEVSQVIEDPERADGVRVAHVNAINTARVVMPLGKGTEGLDRIIAPRGTSIAETYARNVAAIEAAGGIAQINHPNFRWGVGEDDMAELADRTLFEVWNGHPLAHNLGGTQDTGRRALSTEELWDALLSRGKILWGVASDDSHEYSAHDNPDASRPGQAWIMVRASALTTQAITTALKRGDFYASTGIALESILVSADEIAVTIEPEAPFFNPAVKVSIPDDTRYLTRFIGQRGRILAEVPGLHPRYTFAPGDRYVRMAITDSRGRRAWTQPVFVDSAKLPERAAVAPARAQDAEMTRVQAFDLPPSELLTAESRRAARNWQGVLAQGAAACPFDKERPFEMEKVAALRVCFAKHFYPPIIARYQSLYRVRSRLETIGGIPTEVFEPAQGVPASNRGRVLINLHGGSFMFGGRYGGQIESMPIAALGEFKVVSVDYRMAPEHRFPAASEDAIAVYRALLETYRPGNIAIYGCSAGGILTAQTIALMEKEQLPLPGAIGMFCGAAAWGEGDSAYFDAAIRARPIASFSDNPYLAAVDRNDPLAFPARSAQLLARFPPSLLITSTRDSMMSAVIFTHARLVALGVDAQLHVWEGLDHAFFYDPDLPEAREAHEATVKFLDRHLGR